MSRQIFCRIRFYFNRCGDCIKCFPLTYLKNLRKEAAKAKIKAMKKNDAKMKHLRKKFRNNEEEKLDNIPDALRDLKLENLSIFSKKKFDEKETIEYEVGILGDVTLSNNERLILKLPPKFAVEENLPVEGLALDEELAFAKARMTISKEEGERVDEDEGIENDEDAEN